MKRLALLTLAAALATSAALAGDNDWRLRIKKEVDGWTASFSGPMDYGSGRNRVRGSGVRVEKQRALGAFTKLRIDGPIDVRLNQAGSDQATVVADDNIEPLIETVVEGDALVVSMRRDAGFTTRSAPLVRVDARALQAIAVNGSGDLGVERFKADSLSLNLVGSGDVRLGMVELRELSVSISGSGDVELGVTEQLDVQLSGSGDLSYAGRPQLRQSVSGSGEIRRR